MRTTSQEHYALETRAEALALISADAAVRRGESDRSEIGSLASSDAVDGQEAQHTGGDHAESAHAHTVRAVRLETRVDGGMSLRGHSDTTLLGGAMAETYVGPVLLMAGMSDALVAGGGMRVSMADLAVAGLVGFEEKIGSAFADGALIEAYATHFEREYGPGNHVAGFASFTGTVHVTSASGFRPLFKVASGVRNLTAGGGGGGGPEGPAAGTAQRPLPPPPPPTGRPGDAGLIGDAPEIVDISSDLGDLGDVGGDAARALDDAADYEDLDDYTEVGDIVRAVEEPDYAYADVRRSTPGHESTTGAQTPLGEYANVSVANFASEDEILAANSEALTDLLAQLEGGSEASRGTDTADVLGNLRSTAELQGYEDAQRGAILDLVGDVDNAALSDDVADSTVNRTAVILQLRDAEIEASGDAILAAFNGDDAAEAAQNDIAQLYGLARMAVGAGEDPQSALDRLAAIYRWRAENSVEAYAGQADTVADVRASIDAVFRDSGYRAGAVGTDDALDADLAGRLEDLFNTADGTAGTTDETSLLIEDATGLLDSIFDDIDDGAASAISPESTPGRDPRDLTVGEIDAYRSEGENNWIDTLSANADPPSSGDELQDDVLLRKQKLEQWDDDTIGLLEDLSSRPLGDRGSQEGLLEGLRSGEASATSGVERANAASDALAANAWLDRLSTYQLALDAVERGEDPLSALNNLGEIHRWREQEGLATYVGQAGIFEDARDDIALLFLNNGFIPSVELADDDILPRVQDLVDGIDSLRDSAHGLESSADSTATLVAERADNLVDNIRPDLIAEVEESDTYLRLNWRGQVVDAESLTDVSTDDALRALEVDNPDAADTLYSQLNRDDLLNYRIESNYEIDPNYRIESNYEIDPHYRIESNYEIDPHYRIESNYEIDPHYRIESNYEIDPHYRIESNYETDPRIYEEIDPRIYEEIDPQHYEGVSLPQRNIDDDGYDTIGPPAHHANLRGTEITVLFGDGNFPFVPPRLPEDIDVGSFADFIRVQRDELVDPLTGLPPIGAQPTDIRVRAERQAYDLALEALSRGDDPLALIDDRIRSARVRQTKGAPLIEGEVEVLADIRQAIGEYFDTVRDGTGPIYDYIPVDEARQVDQLRLHTQSLPSARLFGEEARRTPGVVVDDFVRTADARLFGLRSDVATQPGVYEDIDELDILARSTAADFNDGAVPLYSETRTGPFTSRPVLPADPSRRAPPAVLRFNSDDPNRFIALVRDAGSYDGKPVFLLTDSELEALRIGDLDLAILDVDSFQELPPDGFVLSTDLETFAAGQANLGSASDFTLSRPGEVAFERTQPRPALAATSNAVESSSDGVLVTSTYGETRGRSPILPSAGGVARPRHSAPR